MCVVQGMYVCIYIYIITNKEPKEQSRRNSIGSYSTLHLVDFSLVFYGCRAAAVISLGPMSSHLACRVLVA